MIVELADTTSAQIGAALLQARRRAGSPSMGMVLTLIVVCADQKYEDALRASAESGREHPARILLVVTGAGDRAGLDAEIRIGEGSPGEVVIVRLRGELAKHPASVIRPLLLPDLPVVTWWPQRCPDHPSSDELAQLAVRRLTDAASSDVPRAELRRRAENYLPGDTDLAWTRTTPWRALLAAALDQYPTEVTAVSVEAEPGNASADLLGAWLEGRLGLPVDHRVSDGPGITAVQMGTPAGEIAITRSDGLLASYAVPGQPERRVALKRRQVTDLINEELRRMDADPVYEDVVKTFLRAEAS